MDEPTRRRVLIEVAALAVALALVALGGSSDPRQLEAIDTPTAAARAKAAESAARPVDRTDGLLAVAAPTTTAAAATTTVAADRPLPRFALGLTHTQHSADDWGDPASVASALAVARAAVTIQNQHLMGWGALNPEPVPGQYDWSSLDERVALMRSSGAVPVITLCCAPDWMKGGRPGDTDWSRLEEAPAPGHVHDFAALAVAVARRYPDVRRFIVWNELKGFYDAARNDWAMDRYLELYNAVYDALKQLDPEIAVGGPYVVMDSWSDVRSMSNPSALVGPWGAIDQRSLDAVRSFLAGAHGVDFLVVDGTTATKDAGWIPDPTTALDKLAAVNRWLREQTPLPIWWAEWYVVPPGRGGEAAELVRRALTTLARSGAAAALLWGPQADDDPDRPVLWTDTAAPGGGKATAVAGVFADLAAADLAADGAGVERSGPGAGAPRP